MNIKITDFYPSIRDDEKNWLEGSMTISLPDLKIKVLGIHATKKGETYRYRMPDKFSVDETTGKKNYFPVFSFENHDDRKKFMEQFRIKAKEFLLKWIDKTEKLVEKPILPVKKVKLLNQLPDVVSKQYIDLKPIAKKKKRVT